MVTALIESLEILRQRHPDWAEMIEYRFFEGLSQKETAEILGVSDRQIRRWFQRCRVLLVDEINLILRERGDDG